MNYLSRRQYLINEIIQECVNNIHKGCGFYKHDAINTINQASPEEPASIKPIGYRECADALLMMWMSDVITDGECKKIMEKLNSCHERGGI